MPYILRFVQQYQPSAASAFLEIERFQDLERRVPEFPWDRRYRPVSGSEPTHTLIWESEFASLADVPNALTKIAARLFKRTNHGSQKIP